MSSSSEPPGAVAPSKAAASSSSSEPPSTVAADAAAASASASSSHAAEEEESPRDRALREAQEVLDSAEYARVQGFNLLGVVVNPRSTHGFTSSIHSHSSHHMLPFGSSHGRTGSGTTMSAVSSNQTETTALQSLEMTLHQVTEQIDALNHVFDQWSRHYLGTYYGEESQEDLEFLGTIGETTASQLLELPEELATLSLASVQQYMEECGVLAHTFDQQCARERKDRPAGEQDEQEEEEIDEDARLMEELEESVPEEFFQTYFDLTDPKTFCELLVLDPTTTTPSEQEQQQQQTDEEDEEEPQPLKSSEDLSSLPPCLSVPTKDILRLPPPDSFTGHLDKVEVALLKQVRSKSAAFFHETNRFGQLKEWIASLVKDVQAVRTLLASVHDGSVVAWELIPILDARRQDLHTLQHILECANEVLRCKASIGGLLSANDDLTAAEQIQYGRRLLAGTAHAHYHRDDDEYDEEEEEFEMGRLLALSTIGDQLSQYETLVVANLSEELVNIFLSWKMSPSKSSSMYGDVMSLSGSSNGGGIGDYNLPRTSQETQQRVRDIVKALGTCKSLTKAGKAYSNRLNDVIRMTVRSTVAGFASESDDAQNKKESSVTASVTSMTFERFVDCLDMLFEQVLTLMKSAVGVNNFCREEGFTLKDETTTTSDGTTGVEPSQAAPPPPPAISPGTPATTGRAPTATAEAVSAAAELSSKSVSELLRLRKEAHSLVTLEEMKRLWDTCISFTLQLEKASGHKAYGLRSTMLAQAKAFVERNHESNMSSLVAALDSERWTQCDVSAERQAALTRLCSGRAVLSSSPRKQIGAEDSPRPDKSPTGASPPKERKADAEVEGIRYKVVWSCLLLVEMIMNNVACAAHFQALATNVVGKVAELLRLFNSRSTQLVLGAGAIQSAARLKSINAKHLSLVTQCLGMIISILPHVRAALMAQLPSKQHTLLGDLDRIKKEYAEHMEKVLNKFVSIIGGIVEHGLAPRIGSTDFDVRAKSIPASSDGEGDGAVACCAFLEGVSTNTKKMHHVLSSLLPSEHLQDAFSRIFAYLDQKTPVLFIAAAADPEQSHFSLPTTDEGKRRMLLEVEAMVSGLNGLAGVRPWEFTAVTVLERKLEFELQQNDNSKEEPETVDKSLFTEQSEQSPVMETAPQTPESVKDERAPQTSEVVEGERAPQSPEIVEDEAAPQSSEIVKDEAAPPTSDVLDGEATPSANGDSSVPVTTDKDSAAGAKEAGLSAVENGENSRSPDNGHNLVDSTGAPQDDQAGQTLDEERKKEVPSESSTVDNREAT